MTFTDLSNIFYILNTNNGTIKYKKDVPIGVIEKELDEIGLTY